MLRTDYKDSTEIVKRSARGQWPGILAQLAGLSGDQLSDRHQPCPCCGGTDRYRFDDKHQNGDFFCNQCGSGDGFDMLQRKNGWDFGESVKAVSNLLGIMDGPNIEPRSSIPKIETAPPKPKPKPISPVPNGAPAPDFQHFKHGAAAKTWAYRDAAGHVTFHLARFDIGPGHKEILPLSWCSLPDGSQRWAWRAPSDRKKPIYGLELLAARPTDSVLIVEGEKTADAARRLLGSAPVIAVCWLGGSKTRHLVDWSPLAGRSVAIWPDADDDGAAVITGAAGSAGRWLPGLAELLSGIAEKTQTVAPPADAPRGWDIADAEADGWDTARLVAHLRGNLSPAESGKPKPPVPETPDDSRRTTPRQTKPLPIRALGYDKGIYFFLPATTDQVAEITPAQMTKRTLNSLAPATFWERRFPDSNGPDYDAAASWLMDSCHSVGVYNPSRIRGRGCWWEGGTCVLHLGDSLVVNGAERDICDFSTRYIYEAAARLRGPDVDPLSDDDAHALVDTAKLMRWETPGSAMLLAGWVVLAPICGALRWRPHIWITGGAGSGKTTIVSDYVRPLLGGMGIHVQGETTEAGVRQTLGSDALPILFDEAEQNEKRDNQRIQMVLSLMRQSSSESGAVVVKGSAGGQARSFDIRSAFCLVSISTGIKQLADATRISVLALKTNHAVTPEQQVISAAKWDKLRSALALLNPDVGAQLFRRTVDLLPVIRKNAEVFATAAADEFKSQRIGDQYGFLLAGACSLLTRAEVTYDQALEFIRRSEWGGFVESSQELDEERCLSKMLQHSVRVDSAGGARTVSVGELIDIVTRDWLDKEGTIVEPELAGAALARLGFKAEDGYLYVSNSAKGIESILADSPWANCWSSVLRRLVGAESIKPMYFGPGVRTTRAIGLPLDLMKK